MRIRPFAMMLLSGILLLAGCRKDHIVEAPEARLHSISVESGLVLPIGGNASLSFSVRDAAYSFNYTVSSPDCQIRLVRSDGTTPVYYRLLGVVKTETAGTYSAIVEDLGIDREYVEEARLQLVRRNEGTGQESIVESAPFEIRSEGAETGGVVIKTGLPVVYVKTEGGRGVTSKETYVPGTVWIKGTDAFEGLAETGCEIRGRGNTTWSWPKKPYLLRLNEKQHVFGMHKHRRWVLLANFMDRTLMRNLVSMKVSSLTSLAWTPGCVPVELVLNGKHVGSYLLIEQVRVDNHRVAITEMTPEDNTGDAVTGGYLLELDFHYDNKYQWTDPHGHNNQWGSGVPFAVKYPDEEDLTPQQLAYIKRYIADVANVLYGNDFQDPEKGYAAYLDVDSFIDYWIVFEVMGNHELGNPGSVFLHKDRGGKLVAGPCWDFDWGVLSYNTSPHARTGLVNGNAIWYGRLMQDPAFKARLKARFQELLPDLEGILDYIDASEKLLTASAKLNFAMWNPAEDASQNGGRIINGDENMSFHDAVTRLKAIYKERLTVIQKNL